MNAAKEPEPPPENGLWRTILSALESNGKTVRLIAIILVFTKVAVIAQYR